jgi:hypothetical protein
MTVIADTHVHLYPRYDTAAALRTLQANLVALAPDAVPVGFLAEPAGHAAFAALAENGAAVCVNAEPSGSGGVLRSLLFTPRPAAGAALVLLPGRQVVTRERIEILALTLEEPVEGGRPAEATVSEILERDGVPVVSWAPGKWFFRRGRVVRALLDRFKPGELLLGDTSLRPLGWGEPRLMRAARRRGFGVVAGSDPLPARGEERYMGCYATRLEGDWDAARPVASARRLLRAGAQQARPAGRRSGLLTTAVRLTRHMTAKHLRSCSHPGGTRCE